MNPSTLVYQAFDGEDVDGYAIQAFEIPLIFKEIKGKIVSLLEKKPNAIICTGQSPRAMLSLERVAINIADVPKAAKTLEDCGYNTIEKIAKAKAEEMAQLPG
ncbi:unnamed protein product, partial [marine sediment metagenome]